MKRTKSLSLAASAILLVAVFITPSPTFADCNSSTVVGCTGPIGGTPSTGGIPTGGYPGGTPSTGGIPTGGTPSTGGIPPGGFPVGTPSTGGIPTGGIPVGGFPGGTPSTGGIPTGGFHGGFQPLNNIGDQQILQTFAGQMGIAPPRWVNSRPQVRPSLTRTVNQYWPKRCWVPTESR